MTDGDIGGGGGGGGGGGVYEFKIFLATVLFLFLDPILME